MKKIGLLTLILFFVTALSAQEITFDKKNFKDNKKAFKEADAHLEAADDFMAALPFPQYNKALDEYLIAQAFNPKSAHVNYNIGECYLHSVAKFKALKYFNNAFKLNPNEFDDIHYKLGRGYHLNMKWDTAIEHYKLYKDRMRMKGDTKDMAKAIKRIKECMSGKELQAHPVRVWIDNMGANINTKYPEYGMIMTADAQVMYFTSRRANGTSNDIDPFSDGYYEDVYSSHKVGDGWSKAQNVGSPINTKGHDAAVALSPDGSRMILYKDDKGDGNLYESVKEGDVWSKPKKLGKEINSKYHESSAWYTPDGQHLYFVSSRPRQSVGNSTGHDIYVATWNKDKERWGDVKRLPDNVNTPYDEDGIYVHPDGKTLYFSSKGHNSMGGFDVFKTVKQDDGTWSDPVNLGYPINTPDDDVFFVVAANGRDAYMTSYRKEGYGDKDLYKVTILGKAKPPILTGEDMLLANAGAPIRAAQIAPKVAVSSQVTILKGIVRDADTKQPLKADIELVDNEKDVVIAQFSSDSKSGRYLVSLPSGKNYGITVKKEGYLFHSENFNVLQSKGYNEVEKNIDLKKVQVGSSVVLRNIFFDFDKATLRPESKVELNRLIKFLTDNSTLKIEISGYTDSRGSDSYNLSLSGRRAKSVMDYLIAHGISAGRLTSKGYGEANPIISDAKISMMKRKSDREDAFQTNRRTEFKILSK